MRVGAGGESKGKLLVIEDDEAIRLLLVKTFDADFEVITASAGDEGLALALAERPDVVVTDQRMPGMEGVEVLARLRVELPLAVRVLVTGHAEHAAIVDAINAASVHHYEEKPFHRASLRLVVSTLYRGLQLERDRKARLDTLVADNLRLASDRNELSRLVDERTSELQTANVELREANDRLLELTVRDSLTGLFNHRTLMEHLDLEVARSHRYERAFSLLFLDVDDFKQVNDMHGHQVGDHVLRTIGGLLNSPAAGIRQSDFGARYGGEEFCVVLPETGLEGGLIKGRRICESVRNHKWCTEAPLDKITLSVGVATFPHFNDAATLIHAADSAMYLAKQSGKDQVCVAPGAPNTRS